MTGSSLRDQAVDLLTKASGIESDITSSNIEEMEDQIELYKWMFRNGIECIRINEILEFLLTNKSIKAAKAIIELEKSRGADANTTQDIFSAVTRRV